MIYESAGVARTRTIVVTFAVLLLILGGLTFLSIRRSTQIRAEQEALTQAPSIPVADSLPLVPETNSPPPPSLNNFSPSEDAIPEELSLALSRLTLVLREPDGGRDPATSACARYSVLPERAAENLLNSYRASSGLSPDFLEFLRQIEADSGVFYRTVRAEVDAVEPELSALMEAARMEGARQRKTGETPRGCGGQPWRLWALAKCWVHLRIETGNWTEALLALESIEALTCDQRDPFSESLRLLVARHPIDEAKLSSLLAILPEQDPVEMLRSDLNSSVEELAQKIVDARLADGIKMGIVTGPLISHDKIRAELNAALGSNPGDFAAFRSKLAEFGSTLADLRAEDPWSKKDRSWVSRTQELMRKTEYYVKAGLSSSAEVEGMTLNPYDALVPEMQGAIARKRDFLGGLEHQERTTVPRVQCREAVIRAAVAITRYWREHGAYPGSIHELVPDYLDAVPTWRREGGPVHYTRIPREAGGGFAITAYRPTASMDVMRDPGNVLLWRAYDCEFSREFIKTALAPRS